MNNKSFYNNRRWALELQSRVIPITLYWPIFARLPSCHLHMTFTHMIWYWTKFDKLRTWLIIVPSTVVGNSHSHNRLSCRHQYHQFCTYWQNLTLERYRSPFSTSSLARFRDCGLLRLHLLVLSHALSCGLGARSYFRTIGYFASPKSYTLLLYFSI